MRLACLLVTMVTTLLIACGGEDGPEPTDTPSPDDIVTFSMQSNAFADGAKIPARFTCDGDDVSPSLFWEQPPEGTEAFVLIMDDSDVPAGVFTHWLYYDIPGAARSLPEAVEREGVPPSGGFQGFNSFAEHIVGYQGPCPPQGQTHRYTFQLFAVDATLNLAPGASRQDIDLSGHVLGQASLTGEYGR